MLASPLVLAVGGSYLALLFVIAFATDRLAAAGRGVGLFSPVVYTLSLAVYCTSWTFYGAVGTAVRSGLEFVTIYIGPTLVLMAWWVFLPKLVRIAKAQRITSIADFLSARYGKSRPVAVLVTLIAIASITPYIALQLLAISRSFSALVGEGADGADTGFWVAVAMCFFVCLFGTRRLNADESQPGIVAAIAFESVVKLAALLAISLFAVLLIRSGPAEGAAFADWHEAMRNVAAMPAERSVRWVILSTLSAIAIVCLPRQFQVTVVENRDERHLAAASWLFPLYLFLITLAVLPIAAAGLTHLPAGAEPDLFVLTVPLAEGVSALALVAFIGGLSAATSMVIVASLALAVMISNHLVAPELADRPSREATGLTAAVLFTRRVAIVVILTLGYLYSRASGADNGLASIGLIAFAGVAQFAPALFGGLFWRRANRFGATAGLVAGAAVWIVTLLLPSFGAGDGFVLVLRELVLTERMASGPGAVDPLVFGVTLSLALNTALYVAVSLATEGAAIDQLQATLFVDALHRGGPEPTLRRSVSRRDLYRLTQRILGPARAHAMFAEEGGTTDHQALDSAFVSHVEREIGYAVGAASAHTMVTRVATGEPLSVDAAITLLRETQDAIEAARHLGVRSVELERTAAELRTANATLTELLQEKDDFLSRVSHEMRTPLTAVRAFAELLRDGPADADRSARFIEIIFTESERLTRLLDDILDLSRLEAGIAPITVKRVDAASIVAASAAAMEGFAERNGVTIKIDAPAPVHVAADGDRLKQVLVNLISNAVKFHGDPPEVTVAVAAEEGAAVLRVSDHGAGVPDGLRPRLFTKFGAAWGANTRNGAGLGLAISRQIMVRLGGDLKLERSGPRGSTFTAVLPLDRTG
ncbi:sensor histidine kinase [Acuticoccus sp. M5D2P5]|uniref:sensor histidine kinase n=1 Tax=Acuticoccus kalidii TaxID=2910977 RepID=UPI001F42146E|nr:sensor histidine kinase [Acuticoccus kalidii]MCF3932840.1 sensor histidine kinase [Acuticoccus kalidii]